MYVCSRFSMNGYAHVRYSMHFIVTTKPCIGSEEVKQIVEALLQKTEQRMQEYQNELKAEIQQLKNETTGEH